jgi:hypothetical protein
MRSTLELYREIDDLQEREDDALWEKWECFWEGWQTMSWDEGEFSREI